MISLVYSLPAGRAIRLLVQPPMGAQHWVVLRKGTPDFTGHDDPDAVPVPRDSDRGALDVYGLIDGQTYYYQAWYFDGMTWTSSSVKQGQAQTGFVDASIDVLMFLRERLEYGLAHYVKTNRLTHENGYVPVLTSPPMFGHVPMPIVTCHLADDSPAERGVGDSLLGDRINAVTGQITETDGWLSRYVINIIGWSLNADERAAMRKAIKAIVLSCMPVFDSVGMQQVEFSVSDTEDFESFNAPVFQCVGTFICVAPSAVEGAPDAIASVDMNFGAEPRSSSVWPAPYGRILDPYDTSRPFVRSE